MDWMGTYPYLTRTVEELRKRELDPGLDLFVRPDSPGGRTSQPHIYGYRQSVDAEGVCDARIPQADSSQGRGTSMNHDYLDRGRWTPQTQMFRALS